MKKKIALLLILAIAPALITLLNSLTSSFIPSSFHPFIPCPLSAQIPADGLVAWYPFNGNANDESGNGNNGTVNGATLTADRFGNVNGAYSFDANVVSSIVLPMSQAHFSPFTISVWVKPYRTIGVANPSNACINASAYGMYCGTNQNWVMMPQHGGDTQLGIGLSIGTNSVQVAEHASFVLESRMTTLGNYSGYTHVVIKYQADSSFLYINGIKTYSRLNACSAVPKFVGSDIYLGYNYCSPNFSGEIDDYGFWNRALTSSEIQQLYQDQTSQVQQPLTCSITAPVTTICEGESVTLSVNSTGGVGSSSQLPANLQQGLVAYYPFNGNANDESGNGDSLVSNGPVLGNDYNSTPNSAMSFNGVYPNYLYSSNGYLNLVNTSLTVSAWIYPNSQNVGLTSIISKVSNTTTNIYGSYGLSLESGIVKFTLANVNGQPFWYNQCNSPNAITNNEWHHILGVANKLTNVMELYVDGVLVASNSWFGQLHNGSNQKFFIGASYKSNFSTQYVYHFNGKIDEVTVHNRALSPAEIQQLYTSQSYAWNTGATTNAITVTPTMDTTYSCTVTQGNSTCTASVDITVNPAVTNAISASIVVGQPYTLGTQTLTTAGTYTEVFTSSAGCDSIVTLTLAIEPLLTCNVTSPVTTICEGESVTLSVNTTGGAGSSSQLPSNLQQGLVAYYPFNGNANDESGNGNDGVVNGATLTSDRFGNTQSCYSFNGNSWIEVLNSTSLNNESVSISGWFNSNELATDISTGCKAIIGKWWQFPSSCNSNYNAHLCVLTKPGSISTLGGATSFYEGNVFTANQAIGIGQWYHFTFTHDSSIGGKIYINGQLANQNSSPGSICNSVNSLHIGADVLNGNLWRFFNGEIDDISIYNRALSTSEIQQLYTSQSFAWNTGATTNSITVTPTMDTTYSCTVTQGNSTCTASVDITVNPAVSNGISASIVEGGSYILGTQTLTTAGTYTEVFTSSTGCDSTVTLTLAIEPLLTCDISSVNTTICQGSATVLTTNAPPSALQIGSVGPGGGLIFYDKGIESNGWRYLEAAPGDIDLSSWGCPDNFISGASQSGIGFGLSNSLAIAQQCSDPNSAASRCLNYSVNGKDNWHLPSKEEFNVMYQNLISQGLGNFATEAIPSFGLLYWTSTQFDSGSGWHYYGVEPWLFAAFSKLYAIYVRPVRYVSQSEVISSSVLWSNGATTPTTTVSPTSNTIYYCTVTTDTQTCTDSIAITVNPALTWYVDADGDGFGNPNAVVLDCNQPAGYVTDNTDCNDAVVSAFPGGEEICDNNIDEDCNGQDSICFVAVLGCTNANACNFNPLANTDDNSCILPQPEVCDGLDNNCNNQIDEGFTIPTINPVAVTPALYPVCTGNALKSADFNNGTNSPIIDGNGPDLWYSFTAQFNTLRVGLSAAFGDNSIGLYTLNNGCLELITEEHEVYTATTLATGNQILLSDQLTVGQTYYVAVHQITGPTNTSAKVCFTYLNGSACDHYYSNNTGVYTSVCNSFKAQYRANATNYIFNVLSGTQNGVDMNLTPWSYTNNNSNSVVARLGSILPANHSGANRVYTLAVPVVYGLTDAAGNVSSLLANATTTCTLTLNSEATIALRQADRCPATKSITATIAPDRTVCGAMRYDWEFTQVLPTPGTAQVVQGGAYASVFFLSNIPGVAAGKTYNVRVRPVHTSGITGNWGAVHCMRIGAAGMILQNESDAGMESRVTGISIYPNPTATGSFVLQYNSTRRGEWTFAQEPTASESTQELAMMDITGKVVFKTNVVLNGNAAEINFGNLASGVYVVMVGEERLRLIVE